MKRTLTMEEMPHLSATPSTPVKDCVYHIGTEQMTRKQSKKGTNKRGFSKELFPSVQSMSKGEACAWPIDTSSRGEGRERLVQKARTDHIMSPCLDAFKAISTAALRVTNLSMTVNIFLLCMG